MANLSKNDSSSELDELREVFTTFFGERDVWEVIDRNGNKLNNNLSPMQKNMYIKKVCDGKYSEKDLIFIRVIDDFSSGLAFTRDAFCYGGDFRNHLNQSIKELLDKLGELSEKYWENLPEVENGSIKYENINEVEFSGYNPSLERKKANELTINFELQAPKAKIFSFEDEFGNPLRAADSEWILIGQSEQIDLWNEINEEESHFLKIERGKLRSHLIDGKILWQIGKFLEFVKP